MAIFNSAHSFVCCLTHNPTILSKRNPNIFAILRQINPSSFFVPFLISTYLRAGPEIWTINNYGLKLDDLDLYGP